MSEQDAAAKAGAGSGSGAGAQDNDVEVRGEYAWHLCVSNAELASAAHVVRCRSPACVHLPSMALSSQIVETPRESPGEAMARHARDVPPEPPADDPGAVRVAIKLPSGKREVRRFKGSDTLKVRGTARVHGGDARGGSQRRQNRWLATTTLFLITVAGALRLLPVGGTRGSDRPCLRGPGGLARCTPAAQDRRGARHLPRRGRHAHGVVG